MKILVIEDEPTLAKGIQAYLEKEAGVCEIASTFETAWQKSQLYEYDCILVDIGLPDGNGLDLIRKLKAAQLSAGIIIISAKNSLADKIEGLGIGSDDYLSKPFHLSELNARIKAVIRRRQFGGTQKVEFGEISVFPENHRVEVKGQELKLTRSEFSLLVYLLANQKRVLSKESIAEHLVGEAADNMGSFDFVYSHIKNLRRKLIESGAEDYIHAVYGIGYKFG